MALSAELLKKFKLEDVPLSDKLIAAKILFSRSEFCYVNRKEEVILEWLLELLSQDLKKDLLNEVWQTLQICLQCETMKHLKVVDINFEITETLVKLLIQSLDSQLCGRTLKKSQSSHVVRKYQLIRECSVLLVENNVFLYYFKKKAESYVRLSQLGLKTAAKSGEIKIFIRYLKSIEFFDQSLYDQRSHEFFINNLLLPIVDTFCLLEKSLNSVSSVDHKLEVIEMDNSSVFINIDSVKSALLSLIQQIIFPSLIQKNVKHGLEQLFTYKSLNSSILNILFKFLVKNASYHDEILKNVYASVFEAFVLVCKDDFNVIFRFFVTLCVLLGFEIRFLNNEESSEVCLLTKENISEALNKRISVPQEESSLIVVREIISVLKKVNLLLDDTINEISFKKWMQSLMVHLCSSFRTFPIRYSIVTIIIELNPLIFAPIINKILATVLLKPKTTEKEREEYEIFFHAMFTMLLKVQPLQNFIRFNLLPTLKEAIEERRGKDSDIVDITNSDILPDGFVRVLGKAVETISGHAWCVSLVRVFSNILAQYVVVPMEEGNFDGGHQLFLEVLENLLVSFLGGIKIAEQTVLEGTYIKFSNNFFELQICLGRFCIALLQLEHCSKSLASFLHLCYAVGELQLLLLLYSPWSKLDEHVQVGLTDNLANARNQVPMLSFLSPQQWNDIRQRATDLGDEVCQKYLNALLQQQLRTLVLFDMNTETQHELSEYLIESLEGVQLLQKSSDLSLLVPLISHEKLVSAAENIIVHLVNEPYKEMLVLLKDPVLEDNKALSISLVWKIMEKIGNVLSKRKRTHSCEGLNLRHKCLVRDLCVYIKCFDLLHPETNSSLQEYTLEMGQKINKAIKDLFKNDQMATDRISFNLRKLLRHLELLRHLPLPCLPQETQAFVAVGILGVYVVLCEFSAKCSSVFQNQSEEENYTSQCQITSIKNLCREILLGLLDGPSPVSVLDLLDVGLLVQLLHQDGQCPKLLLELLFEDCIKKPEHLQKVVEAVCLVDDYVKDHINIDTSPIGALLFQILRKKNISNISEELRTLYQKNTHHLLDVLSQLIHSRMKSENVSEEKSALALLSSYFCVLSSRSPVHSKMVVPYVENFVACAFSVLENPDVHQDAVPMAEHILEVVVSCHKRIGKGVSGNVMWRTYKSLNRPHLVTQMLKNAALPDFKPVLEALCNSLKPGKNQSKEFPDLHLPSSLVSMPMEDVKAVYVEQMVVLVSCVAFDKIIQRDSDDKLPDFLMFLLKVAKRTKMPLPCELADIILRTIMCALSVKSMSREYALSTSTTVIQLLSKMVLLHFPLVNERIPALMMVYHMVVHTVVINSAVELQLTVEEAEKFSRCALEIEQLTKSLSNHSLAFKAVSQHLVADMLQELEKTAIHHKVKFHIMNSLYALMDLCDRFAFAHLCQALGPASLELFKTVRKSYRKFYRYTGKV